MSSQQSHRKVFVIGGIMATVMFIFCFAMVPLYSLICKATGINTSAPNSGLLTPVQANTGEAPDLTRTITVQFVAVNHNGLPWDFYPHLNSIQVHPGENIQTSFYAKNTTNHDMTIQAIPSITPPESINYFHKIQCFCFTQQTLKAGESKDMSLIFRVDKDLPKEIRVITLAYTLFDATPKAIKKGIKK